MKHMLKNQVCKTCGILDSTQNVCQLNGIRVEPDADFCSHWTDNIQTCDLCGRKFIGPGTLTEVNGKFKQTCSSCDDAIGTCRTCANRQEGYCKFHDHSFRPDVPPTIVKSIQKGPAIMQAQVPNPEREKITCEDGCSCFKPDFGCCKEARTCGNHTLKW